MTKLRPTTLAYLLMGLPDLAFTPLYLAAVAQLLGLESGPTAVIATVVYLLRQLVYWRVTRIWVRPSEAVQERLATNRPVTASALQAADHRLQTVQAQMMPLVTVLWALQIPMVVGAYHWFVGMPALPFGESLIVALLTVAGGLGCYAEASPLYAWQFADLSGQNSLAAEKLGVDLERPQQSVAVRLTVLSLILALAPLLIMLAFSRSTSGQSDFANAELEARTVAATLDAAAPRDLTRAFHSLSSDIDLERVSAFRLDAGREPQVLGRPLPVWATPELLAAGADGPSVLPDHRVALRAMRRPDGGVVGALVRMDETDSERLPMALAVLLVLSIWAPVCAWNLSRSVSVPLGRAADVMRRAVEVGDLSRIGTLPMATVDEAGLVTQYLNRLIASMRALAAAAGKVGAGQLAADIDGAGELPEAFRQMLTRLRAVVKEMQGTSAELAAAATEILAATQEQEAASTSHSAGVVEIAQTMDSLSEASAHVAGAAQGLLENAERTLANTDHMVKRIDELTDHANRIGDILEIIRDIADRTDLLALNGSLEATRAGEAGLGFSLVASEMRRLAERVAASVADIKTLVGDIRESGASTVVATEESKKLADGTTAAARNITLVSQQQQTSTEQVSQNVRAIAEVVRQAATATTQTRASAEGLKVQAERLAGLVQSFQLGE